VTRLRVEDKGVGFLIPVALEIFLMTPSRWGRYFLVLYMCTANSTGSPVQQAMSVLLQDLYNHPQVAHFSYHRAQYSLGA
jgi:hypothetical protein